MYALAAREREGERERARERIAGVHCVLGIAVGERQRVNVWFDVCMMYS